MSKVNFFKELKESECMTLQELYNVKGRGFSPKTIRKWITEGRLTRGKHYIQLPGKTGMFKVNLAALNHYLEEIN
jgi:hypothetical protein